MAEDTGSGTVSASINGEPLRFIGNILSTTIEDSTIQKVNRGFIVKIGCQRFVFEKEKDMFTALSEYWKNPKEAEKKYVDKK